MPYSEVENNPRNKIYWVFFLKHLFFVSNSRSALFERKFERQFEPRIAIRYQATFLCIDLS